MGRLDPRPKKRSSISSKQEARSHTQKGGSGPLSASSPQPRVRAQERVSLRFGKVTRLKSETPCAESFFPVEKRQRKDKVPEALPSGTQARPSAFAFVPCPPEERLRLVQFSERPGVMLLPIPTHDVLAAQSLHHKLFLSVFHDTIEVDSLPGFVEHLHNPNLHS